MKMNDVEFLGFSCDHLQHAHMRRERVDDLLAFQTQSTLANRTQFCSGDGVSTGKQRDVMTLPDTFVCQIRNYSLRSPVEFGRYTFVKRSNLCNSHIALL